MLPNNTLVQGRYQIVEQIGRGGMGAVYKAVDIRLRATVALKQMLVEGEPLRKAFEREAQLLAGLRHPALPRVSDHFVDERGQFLVMEYIPGQDLGELLEQRKRPFPAADVLRWADQLLDTLDYLHTRRPPVIHRDIKPQNMKLTERGEIILLDFGLAKGSAAQTRVTSTGSIFGYTPHYAPLEQIHGTGTDQRSDLYALAAALYHLLTNIVPVDALTRAAAVLDDDPDPLPPAHYANPEVPPEVSAILYQAMAQSAKQRPLSAAAMRAALRQAGQDVAAGAGKPTEPKRAANPRIYETAPLPRTVDEQVIRRPDPRPPAQPLLTAPDLPRPGTAPIATRDAPEAEPASQQPARRRWLWAALVVPALLVVGALAVFATRGGGPAPQPTPTTELILAAAPVSPTTLPTSTPAPTVDAQQAAALAQAAASATARAIADLVGTAGAQTAAAQSATQQASLAPTPTAAPTEAPTAAPTSPPTTAPTRGPTKTPAPTLTAGPTATPQPSQGPPPSGARVLGLGSGAMFRATADLGSIAPEGTNGSCIEGRVSDKGGSLFSSFGVSIDMRGNTREPKANYAAGTYSICGLPAGEWGISVYMAGGVDIPGSEKVAHQVRVLLTGTPGEVFYVNFRGTDALVVPTPTPAPTPSEYDGLWSGTLTGKTENNSRDFDGHFRMEVKYGAIYRISVDGASCFFDTYPNWPKGQPMSGNAFSVSAQVFNPLDSSKNDISYSASGTFTSTSRAGGSFNASQGGGSCIAGSWSASKQ